MNLVKTTLSLSFATLLAVSTQSLAQAPTSRPAGERNPGMAAPGPGPGPGGGERRWDRERLEGTERPMGDRPMGERGMRRGGGRQVTEEQWDEIRKFMAEHSPRRTAELENMG